MEAVNFKCYLLVSTKVTIVGQQMFPSFWNLKKSRRQEPSTPRENSSLHLFYYLCNYNPFTNIEITKGWILHLNTTHVLFQFLSPFWKPNHMFHIQSNTISNPHGLTPCELLTLFPAAYFFRGSHGGGWNPPPLWKIHL